MENEVFTNYKLPRFHPHKLILNLQVGAAAGAAAAAAAGGRSIQAVSFSPLEDARRNDLITRFIPLGYAARAVSTRDAPMSFMTALTQPSGQPDPLANVVIVELQANIDEKDFASQLRQDPLVRSATLIPARYLCVSATPGASKVPGPAQMWNLNKIRWDKLPDRSKSAAAVKVAVLDTGIDTHHPALPPPAAYFYAHPDVPGISSDRDIVGHGTHVAGIIAARLGGSQVSGICNCELYCWKIFTDEPEYIDKKFQYMVDPAMYLEALRSCEEKKIDVINLSIGGPEPPSDVERSRFEALLQQGTVIVAAMGNERKWNNPISYPAAIDGVIAVGATDQSDTVAHFSNRGDHITVCAPGVDIWSTLPTYPGNHGFPAIKHNGTVQPDQTRPYMRSIGFAPWNGTSMSTPHVSAAVALLIARFGKESPALIKRKVMSAAQRVAGMNGLRYSPDYGAGRLDLVDLLQISDPVPVQKLRQIFRKIRRWLSPD